MKRKLILFLMALAFTFNGSLVYANDQIDNSNEMMTTAAVEEAVVATTIPIATENAEESVVAPRVGTVYKVIGSNVNVRTGAGTSYSSIGMMQWGGIVYDQTKAQVSANGYTWLYVKCGAPLTGQYGWIAKEFLQYYDN